MGSEMFGCDSEGTFLLLFGISFFMQHCVYFIGKERDLDSAQF